MSAVIMTEEYWANSHLSVARYYGGIKVNGDEYKIVNKYGITLEELSDPRSKHYVKEGMAIPPGEPADLVRKDWLPIYRKLGRERTIELVKNGIDLKEMSYDIDMCDGMTNDNGYCPLRDKCKRFILGQKALMEDYYPIYWIEPCYEDGKCELFIEVKEETK